MKTNPFLLTATALLSALLCSCALFAPEPRQDLNHEVPQTFSLYSADVPDTTNRWWNNFHSSELNSLINEALTNNPSIQQAWARLAQAEAFAIKVGASRYPSLGYDGGTSARKNSIDYETEKSYSMGLNASYELDLWGRIKSETEAAALDRDASREQLSTVAISLSSQVALNWIGVLSQRLQTDVIHRQLEANKTSLELIELRFRKSLSSALDVYQQRQTVAGTESRLPLAELREDLLFNGLAALLGYADFQSLDITQSDLPILGQLPALGIPADVLANRPDVRQAGLRLYAADWSVSAAREIACQPSG